MKKTCLVILFIILTSCVVAEDYYADLELTVDEAGIVHIQGESNYPQFNTERTEYLTSKKGPYWLLNITTKEVFSDYFVSVQFPKNTEINYIQVNGGFRITQEETLKLITTGEDEPIRIVAQYKLVLNKNNNVVIIVGLIILIALSGLIIFFKFKKNTSKPLSTTIKTESENHKVDNPPINHDVNKDKLKLLKYTLTENQKLIIDILLEAKEPISQKQILHRSKLPKSTLSRNLDIMEKKNILKKQSRGMVNVIFLNEEFIK